LLDPFLFLLGAEGFSELVRNVANLNMFKGFGFRQGVMKISHLKYADYTLCVGKATVEKL